MKPKQYIIFFLAWMSALSTYAQIIPPQKDSVPSTPSNSELIELSKVKPLRDSVTIPPGGASTSTSINLDSVQLSDDALDAPVDYSARDSMWFDVTNETVHLYGDAKVTYRTLNMTAAYISFNMDSSIVVASGMIDSSGQLSGLPKFEDGDQKFDAKKVRYNFKTNKGIIYEAVTTEKDLYVLGEKAAYFGQDEAANRKTDVVYSEHAIFTTCSHPEPHFGIRSTKQKVIPNDVVVVGPSNIEIGGIPTPLWLPFAFFPLKQGARTGLIFPRDYEYSDAWGFGLRDVGWYFPMGDYWDLKLTGMIYTRGTWGLTGTSQYRKRYKHNGSLTLGYSDRKTEQQAVTLSQKSLNLRWSHTQDAKAHPTNSFSGSVNIQTNDYQSLNQNDAASVLENTLSSSVRYSKSFPDKPFNFTASMNHSQNTQSRRVDITLPSINFNMNRVYPFKRKNSLDNKEKWYEKVSFQYKGVAQNRFTATDTTLFSNQTLEDARFGIKHTVNTNASFRVLKYFNLTPSVDYKEIWYFDRTRKELEERYVVDTIVVLTDPDTGEEVVTLDTTQYGTINEISDFAWNPLRLFNTSLNLSTQIFGVRTFTKGKIRGIRHIIKPSVSLNYTPDYTDPDFGYFEYVDSDLRPDFNEQQRYSIFEDGIYEDAPTSGRQMSLNYSISNIFEAKYWSNRDSTAKNFKLFDNIYVNGNYNFAADSLNWSQVRISGTTRLFNGLTTLNFSTDFDPYAADEEGRRINTFNRDTGGKLLRYVRSNIRINTPLTVRKIRELFSGEKERSKSGAGKKKGGATGAGTSTTAVEAVETGEGLLDLIENFRISHQLTLESTADTFFIRTNNISMNGNIQLTDKWSIRVGNIAYDFKSKSLVYPDVGFYRDLHCWQMGMDWQPRRGTFSFYLRVKPGSLDFIEVPYRRGNPDGFRGF